jgi:DNA-binding LytR/AlgR family response regulator
MSRPGALIAEDEPLLAQALAAELARQWPELQIVAQAGDGLQAIREALTLLPQVCFLDIRMPGADGLEVARALAEEWPAQAPFPLLVFVTAYDQYAVQAFERQAIDYLLKPLEAARLAQCVARLRRELERPSAAPADQLAASIDQLRDLLTRDLPNQSLPPPGRLEVIQAGVGETLHMVPVDEVIYFEAADKYVRLLTAEREHLIRLSLRELLPQLDPQRFWQIHRGTVVQARRIATAERQESGRIVLTLRGRPEKLAVSRLHAHLFKGM